MKRTSTVLQAPFKRGFSHNLFITIQGVATSADSEASKFSGACIPMTLTQVSESYAVLIRVLTV